MADLSQSVARAKEITTLTELESWIEATMAETDRALQGRRGVIAIMAADRLIKTFPEQRKEIEVLKVKVGCEIFRIGYGPGLTPPLGSS